MCGIAGAFSTQPAEPVVRRMTDALAHRGPDDAGCVPLRDRGGRELGAFGHRRLSILDLSPAGHQPMRTEDGRFTISFNGEIYNFRALRAELERDGVRFHSATDTEVILLGWALYGADFVHRLDGMYAFALWDREEKRGWLIRDPFGIKPLYVAEAGGAVLFGSELRALLASEVLPRRPSRDGLVSYLATGSAAEPFTMVDGVRMVPAGTVTPVAVTDAGVRLGEPEECGGPGPIRAPCAPLERDGQAAARAVREALRASVERHLVSDVPVGFFLSGGLDSSAVVALAAESGRGALDTFTITFTEARFNEAVPARVVADRFGTRHHEIPLSGDDLLRALPAAFAAMDQPSMDGLNTFVVSRAVRERGIKVVLSGLGGDEFFAGYPSFQRASRCAPLWRMPAGARQTFARVASARGGLAAEKSALLLRDSSAARGAYRASRALFGPVGIGSLMGGAPALPSPAAPAGLSLLQQVSWYELTGYMRNTLLRDSDVFSMAHGLELRVPLVDLGVAAVAAGVDDSLKLSRGLSKPLLLSAVRDLLPREVWDRRKQGFTLPFEVWIRGPLRAEVDAALMPGRLARVRLNAASARGVWNGFLQGRVGWSRPWALYTLVRWAEVNGVESERAIPSAGPAWELVNA